MLKSKNARPCDCGSGRKYKNCCGDPVAIKAAALSTGRDCGDCQACCHLIGVSELGKPYATTCQHQCAAGCAIYKARPFGCRVYECNWRLTPEMPMELRPDLSGIMVSADQFDAQEMALFFFEAREGALNHMDDWFFGLMSRSIDRGEKIVIVPHGSANGTSFKTAPQYMTNDRFDKPSRVFSSNNKCFVMVETLDECHSVLKRMGLE